MSTHSGAINSLAAAATNDIYLPIAKVSPDDPRALRISRGLAVMWGVILTGGALMFHAQGTPVVVLALSIASFTYGGLLGGFFLGIFWRRAMQRFGDDIFQCGGSSIQCITPQSRLKLQ